MRGDTEVMVPLTIVPFDSQVLPEGLVACRLASCARKMSSDPVV
jgi:hypothetical protein